MTLQDEMNMRSNCHTAFKDEAYEGLEGVKLFIANNPDLYSHCLSDAIEMLERGISGMADQFNDLEEIKG